MQPNFPFDLSLVLSLGTFVDAAGVLIIVFGLILSVIIFLRDWYKEAALNNCYTSLRQNLGRAILLGLEFLVAGDIIRSVAGSPTFASIGILAMIVIIRTFLSVTFEMEVEGRWPWQKKP